MRKIFIFTCLFLAVFALHARAIQEDINLAEEKAQASYAIGMMMGSNLQSMGIELDYNAYLEGLKAIMEGAEPQIGMNEAMELTEAAIDKAEDRAAEHQRLIQEDFLSNNSANPGVNVTPSGLQFEIILEGSGEKPAPNDVVKVIYTGALIDGTVFDKSEDTGSYIPLEMVIPGWGEGLQLMNVGSKHRIYIPANLAYGKNGVRGIIPQYATLVFDVELVEIMDRSVFFAEDVMEFEF
ncbi:MAG: FKBP-type peptidyl-prolyl cis-trans isomerase [Treponema sp.]|jgi:FKBP-type peptidyl-prolyl cis-trans isomerase|nr:FKBP-type peptidyl-prolyl cis-trans isomerase [Treponema sp.]